MATFFLKPRMEVTVNGSRRRAFSVDVALGASSPIASGSVAVDPRDAEVAPGDTVSIKLGYWGGSFNQVFSGHVDDDSIVLWPNAISFNVVGELSKASYRVGIEGDEETDPDTGEVLPLQTWEGETDGAIVTALLDLVGIAYAEIEDSGTLLGTVQPIALMPSETPLSLIQQIDEALGYVTYDGPDGLVRRTLYTDVPSGSPALVIKQGTNLYRGQRQRSASEVYNLVKVTGVENPDFTPEAKLASPSAVSPTTGLPYIPTPPEFRLLPYSSTILDTEDLCATFAARVLGEKNRLRWSTEVSLPSGNAALRPAQSCYLLADKLDFDTGAVFWIDQVKHRADASAFLTDLTLRGAYAAEGVNTNQAPIPAFDMKIKYEYTPDGGIWIILVDASGSTDPDGAFTIPPTVNEDGETVQGHDENGIARYVWTTSIAGVAATPLDDGKRATFLTGANPNGETITLTVYDLQGRSAALTRTIIVTDSRPALVRDLWAAVNSELLFTKDGERSWQSVAVPAVFVVEMSAYDYTLALDAGGTLYRVKSDLTFTTPASAPTNCSAAFIRWIYPETRISGERAWLGTANGEVWFSPDRGMTWTKQATLAGGARISSMQESPFAENDIWLTAGGSIWHSYDGVNFENVYTHPNASLVATNITSGFGHGFAAFKGTNVGDLAEASRVRERFNAYAGDWPRTNTTPGLAAGTYKAAYSYRASGGETLLSPQATITIAAGKSIQFAAITPLPDGATGVRYYLSETAGSTTLRRLTEGLGSDVYTARALPLAGAAAPATTNTTDTAIANPSAAPTVSAVDGTPSGEDFPAQPTWLTIGIDDPILMAVGSSPQATSGAAWYAQADTPFTFQRGIYHTAGGLPQHTIRDGDFPGVAYAAATGKLLKTTTYYKVDCFPILVLSGAQSGKMIGYGDLHTPPTPVGMLTALAVPASGPHAGTVRMVRATTADPSWVDLGSVGMTGPFQLNPKTRLVRAGEGHYFAWCAYRLSSVPGRFGELWETTDDGASWTNIPEADHITAFSLCDDGSYYFVVAQPDGSGGNWGRGQSQIVYHDGTGFHNRATYDTDYPSGITAFTGIAADPTNPLNVAYQSHNGAWLSTDGGVTFPTNVIGSGNVSSNTPEAMIEGTDGRLVLVPYNGATNTAPIQYAPWPSGPMTITPKTVVGQNLPFVRAPSGNLYIVGGGNVVQSTDNGATWNDLPIPVPTPKGVVELSASGDGVFGLAAQHNGTGTVPDPWRIAWWSSVDGGVTWTDLTAQQVDDLGTLYVPILGCVAR